MYDKYSYVIVGAGLAGCTIARKLTDKGYKCLIVEQRNHIGGNCYVKMIDGIEVHQYGAHVFHTSNNIVINFLKEYTYIRNYRHIRRAFVDEKFYSFPINLLTLNQLFGVKTPEEAKNIERKKIYDIFFKEYSEKQWGEKFENISPDIISQVPYRINFDDNYFRNKRQGMPNYIELFENITKGIDIQLNAKFDKAKFNCKIIYTGMLDDLYDYEFGELKYRSLTWELEKHNIRDYQGCAIVNYPEKKYEWTRVIEHKHLAPKKVNHTIISREIPTSQGIPFYSIADKDNNAIYEKYKRKALGDGYVLCGRLAEWRNMDMDVVIDSALKTAANL